MKNNCKAVVAIILSLVLSLGAIALAEGNRVPMDGFDPSTNWSGTFHNIQFTVPGYYVESEGNTRDYALLYVKGVKASNGNTPALIAFDVSQGPYSPDEFKTAKKTIFNNLLNGANNPTQEGYVEDCTIANRPAAGLQYSAQESDGYWRYRVYPILNEQGEIVVVRIAEDLAMNIDFLDDFEKMIDSARCVSAARNSEPAPTVAPQVSQKVKTLCDNYINSIQRGAEILNTFDPDSMGFLDWGVFIIECEAIYDDIEAFLKADKSGWSSADRAYYEQVNNTVSNAVVKDILNLVNEITKGIL